MRKWLRLARRDAMPKDDERTKPRRAFSSAAEAKRFLDEGGRLEADEDVLYKHMRESQRRLMVMMPVMLYVGIQHMRENMGIDVREDVQIGLRRSAQLAIRYLNPLEHQETTQRIVRDAQRVLIEMNADSIQQSVLAAAYLTLALVDQGRLPDPSAQSVLVSLGILEEAEADAAQGIRGAWYYEPGKLGAMSNRGLTKLSLMGYI